MARCFLVGFADRVGADCNGFDPVEMARLSNPDESRCDSGQRLRMTLQTRLQDHSQPLPDPSAWPEDAWIFESLAVPPSSNPLQPLHLSREAARFIMPPILPFMSGFFPLRLFPDAPHTPERSRQTCQATRAWSLRP